MELLGARPEIRCTRRSAGFATRNAALNLEAVTFRYPARPDTAALDEFSLEVGPGETVALVGPSGASKTTVFQLLLRFYDPQTGTLKLDGVSLSDADPQAVRASLALVPQEPVIFASSVLENVRYACPHADQDAVRRPAGPPSRPNSSPACRRLSHQPGRTRRAPVRRAAPAHRDRPRDPRRPTHPAARRSHLGTRRRERAHGPGGAGTLMRGRTTLVIAHRLATVQKADRIVVMGTVGSSKPGPTRSCSTGKAFTRTSQSCNLRPE